MATLRLSACCSLPKRGMVIAPLAKAATSGLTPLASLPKTITNYFFDILLLFSLYPLSFSSSIDIPF